MAATNKKIVLRNHVTGFPKESDMELVAAGAAPARVPEGTDGAVLVKNLYLSCDPYMRGRMSKNDGSYVDAFVVGEPITGYGVGKVVDSSYPGFKAGDFVWGMTGWEEYSLIKNPSRALFAIRHPDLPLSYYTGLLGMAGFTAYVGFHEIGAPKEGERVFVSAASGAVAATPISPSCHRSPPAPLHTPPPPPHPLGSSASPSSLPRSAAPATNSSHAPPPPRRPPTLHPHPRHRPPLHLPRRR